MSSCFGIGKCYCGYAGCRGHRVDCSVGVEDTTVTMRGVFAKAYIACDVEGGEEFSDLLNCENDRTCGIIRRGPRSILKMPLEQTLLSIPSEESAIPSHM